MNAHLSDLFFNHRHDHRDTYLGRVKPSDHDLDEERKALYEDAVEFSGMIDGAFDFRVHPDDLVEDFYNRL